MSKKDDKEPPQHSGSVVAEDENLTLWLNRLWARGEPPERVELWQMFGRNKVVRGEMIHHEDFKPGVKLDVEQANKLANEIMEAAQNDCDVTRRECWYQIAVLDKNRKASPLTRRVGPLQPKRNYALKTLNHVDNEDDDDDSQNAESILLAKLKVGVEQDRWDKTRNDRVIGELLLFIGGVAKDLREQNSLLFQQNMALFKESQEAQNHALDRELIREKEKFKLSLYRDGVRTARNLLPNLFKGGDDGGGGGGGKALDNGANGHNGGNNNAPRDCGPSPERTLVDNFLHDIEEEGEALELALFGDFDEHTGKQIKPGIFTLKQYAIIRGVRDGRYPAQAVDALLPRSGHECEISSKQIQDAMDAGVTDGIGSAIFELLALRQQARKKDEPEAVDTETDK